MNFVRAHWRHFLPFVPIWLGVVVVTFAPSPIKGIQPSGPRSAGAMVELLNPLPFCSRQPVSDGDRHLTQISQP